MNEASAGRANGLTRRIVVTGFPTLAASGILYLQPIIGRHYLNDRDYATWALGATVLTIGLTIDFGGSAYTVSAAASASLTRRRLVAATALSVAGSLGVGLVAAGIWPFYGRGSEYALAGLGGVGYFLGIAAASAMRSATTIGMSLMMAIGADRRRAAALLFQACFQAAVLVILLVLGAGLWAMPISSIMASAVLLPTLLKIDHINAADGESHAAGTAPALRNFAGVKAIGSVLSLAVTQMDRWVVGLLVGPTALAQYDVTSRLAGLPRLAVIGASGVIVAEAASISRDPGALGRLHRRAVSLDAALCAVGCVFASMLAVFAKGVVGAVPLGLFMLMLVGYGLHSLTAPGTMIMTGVGRPIYDIIFVIPVILLAGLSWGGAALLHAHGLAESASALALAVWSPIFIVLVGRRMGQRSEKGTG